MIKHVLWDLDQVFNNLLTINMDPEFRYLLFFEAANKVAIQYNITNLTAFDIQERWVKSQTTDKPYETSTDVLAYEFNLPYQEVYHLMHEILIKEHIHLFEGNFQLVEEVNKLDHLEHHLVTHSNETWTNYWLEHLSLENFFTSIFNIKSLGLCKYSNKSTYQHILDNISATAEETALVDDSERNLVPAANINIKPFLFSSQPSKNGYETTSCPIELVNIILKQCA